MQLFSHRNRKTAPSVYQLIGKPKGKRLLSTRRKKSKSKKTSDDSHVQQLERESSRSMHVTEAETKIVSLIRSNVIGSRTIISTPFGKREMVYSDYTASGRCLQFIEDYMTHVVAPMYANTHTEASATGAQTTQLREEARGIIREVLNAPQTEYAVLFTANGSTGAIDKIFRVLGFGIPEYADKKWKISDTLIPEEERPVVFLSHLEHHSNELIWRESIARCVVIRENEQGLPDLRHLERELAHYRRQHVPMIGSFSAGSNVTGICTPVTSITRLLHKYGSLAFFDFAATSAYVDVDVRGNGGEDSIDAVFLSPHKLIGGPGASGILVARRNLFDGPLGVRITRPSLPGGGTVSLVLKNVQRYDNNPEVREDAGTPGILSCIRAGLVFKVKEMVGCKTIERLEAAHGAKALSAWTRHPSISLMGSDRIAYFNNKNRISIISFNIVSPVELNGEGGSGFISRSSLRHYYSTAITNLAPAEYSSTKVVSLAAINKLPKDLSRTRLPLHYNFVIALLNDLYGIQGRGGCSCAGPYGWSLFESASGAREDEVQALSKQMLRLVDRGYGAFKYGWARINLNYFIGETEADFILRAVLQIASHGWKLLPQYIQDVNTGRFVHRSALKGGGGASSGQPAYSLRDFRIINEVNDNSETLTIGYDAPCSLEGERDEQSYEGVLAAAQDEYGRAERPPPGQTSIRDFTTEDGDLPEGVALHDIWWLRPSEAAAELCGHVGKVQNS